jgi:hypothetical protein
MHCLGFPFAPHRAYFDNSEVLSLDNQRASHRFTLCFNEPMWKKTLKCALNLLDGEMNLWYPSIRSKKKTLWYPSQNFNRHSSQEMTRNRE